MEEWGGNNGGNPLRSGAVESSERRVRTGE